MSDDNTHHGAGPSRASSGSHVTDPMPKEKQAEISVVLTDAEREAIGAAVAFFCRGYGTTADTLRGLLERLG
jgi:hypothetical protein